VLSSSGQRYLYFRDLETVYKVEQNSPLFFNIHHAFRDCCTTELSREEKNTRRDYVQRNTNDGFIFFFFFFFRDRRRQQQRREQQQR
jgi:hypothetical protein